MINKQPIRELVKVLLGLSRVNFVHVENEIWRFLPFNVRIIVYIDNHAQG